MSPQYPPQTRLAGALSMSTQLLEKDCRLSWAKLCGFAHWGAPIVSSYPPLGVGLTPNPSCEPPSIWCCCFPHSPAGWLPGKLLLQGCHLFPDPTMPLPLVQLPLCAPVMPAHLSSHMEALPGEAGHPVSSYPQCLAKCLAHYPLGGQELRIPNIKCCDIKNVNHVLVTNHMPTLG